MIENDQKLRVTNIFEEIIISLMTILSQILESNYIFNLKFRYLHYLSWKTCLTWTTINLILWQERGAIEMEECDCFLALYMIDYDNSAVFFNVLPVCVVPDFYVFFKRFRVQETKIISDFWIIFVDTTTFLSQNIALYLIRKTCALKKLKISSLLNTKIASACRAKKKSSAYLFLWIKNVHSNTLLNQFFFHLPYQLSSTIHLRILHSKS